jgi:hypothetical protein
MHTIYTNKINSFWGVLEMHIILYIYYILHYITLYYNYNIDIYIYIYGL